MIPVASRYRSVWHSAIAPAYQCQRRRLRRLNVTVGQIQVVEHREHHIRAIRGHIYGILVGEQDGRPQADFGPTDERIEPRQELRVSRVPLRVSY